MIVVNYVIPSVDFIYYCFLPFTYTLYMPFQVFLIINLFLHNLLLLSPKSASFICSFITAPPSLCSSVGMRLCMDNVPWLGVENSF